jgi:hypothetical protein
MPDDEYKQSKPLILTGITLGFIMICAGIVVYSFASQPPPNESSKDPLPETKTEEPATPKESCTQYRF